MPGVNGLSTATGLASLLEEPDVNVQVYALEALNKVRYNRLNEFLYIKL